ncbi:MAG: transposase [Candidatus Ancaeobacter aquaticus]|nr:transposase [Candidatus Ancaeobacter aquaticus]
MSRPLRIEYPGALYHVTARGNERKNIFGSERDNEKFLSYIESAHDKFGLIVHAYCLMPNHYHLLIETPHSNLCKCMHFINSSYTKYFNIKTKRAGHLFQGRYKSILVDKDNYLMALTRYLHLNPVKAKTHKKPQEYKWSSYRYYVLNDPAPLYMHTEFTLGFFNKNKNEYRKYVEVDSNNIVDGPYNKINVGCILGDDDFVREVKEKYIAVDRKTRDLPDLRNITKRNLSPNTIRQKIKSHGIINEQEINKIMVYLLRKMTDMSLAEVARSVYDDKIGVSGVSQITRRMEASRLKNQKFNKIIQNCKTELSNV